MDTSVKQIILDNFIEYLKNSRRGSLNEVAESIGCNRTYLTLWRSGKRNMSDALLYSLANYLIKQGYPMDIPNPVFTTAPGTRDPMVQADPMIRLSDTLHNASLMALDPAPIQERLNTIDHTLRYIIEHLIPAIRSGEQP